MRRRYSVVPTRVGMNRFRERGISRPRVVVTTRVGMNRVVGELDGGDERSPHTRGDEPSYTALVLAVVV